LIVLDTNVVSEIMRARPEPAVLAWLDGQASGELWLSSIVAAELMFGVARLADGARKRQLAQAVQATLEEDFAGRVLPFDLAAASVYADLCAKRERAGLPVAMADAQIAATCLAHDATLATRNHAHFEGLGLAMIDPWTAGSK
jgi:predicted nucleic acid-binding protein